MAQQCIGVFDSGVGGLSVLAHIRSRLPHEDLCYFADSAHMPYGNKSVDELRKCSLFVADVLLKRGAKALVVACNTATAAAAHILREQLDVPVIGMEPGIKPAVHGSARGVVGVLATSGTISSEKFALLMQRFTEHVEVIVQPCPGLVERIEAGELGSGKTRSLLEQYLHPLLNRGVDAVVLGCTHYPFVIPLIRDIAGPDIQIIDTGDAIARELERQLGIHGLGASEGCGNIQFLTSGETETVRPVMQRLWGHALTLESCQAD